MACPHDPNPFFTPSSPLFQPRSARPEDLLPEATPVPPCCRELHSICCTSATTTQQRQATTAPPPCSSAVCFLPRKLELDLTLLHRPSLFISSPTCHGHPAHSLSHTTDITTNNRHPLPHPKAANTAKEIGTKSQGQSRRYHPQHQHELPFTTPLASPATIAVHRRRAQLRSPSPAVSPAVTLPAVQPQRPPVHAIAALPQPPSGSTPRPHDPNPFFTPSSPLFQPRSARPEDLLPEATPVPPCCRELHSICCTSATTAQQRQATTAPPPCSSTACFLPRKPELDLTLLHRPSLFISSPTCHGHPAHSLSHTTDITTNNRHPLPHPKAANTAKEIGTKSQGQSRRYHPQHQQQLPFTTPLASPATIAVHRRRAQLRSPSPAVSPAVTLPAVQPQRPPVHAIAALPQPPSGSTPR
ncbi:uncharacterized protein LOC131151335 [Malania oleifera]|uniref:uncharacterized protein LOC131151335 n=1 Tax=Malania oleifera TaxID=397392 RepID=UPI0025ADF17A|nr:uncharacterized protein LOC131151335 [Malania oleifera]